MNEKLDKRVVLALLLAIGVVGFKFVGQTKDSDHIKISYSFIDTIAGVTSSDIFDKPQFRTSENSSEDNQVGNPFSATHTQASSNTIEAPDSLEGKEYLPTGEVDNIPENFEKWMTQTFLSNASEKDSNQPKNDLAGDNYSTANQVSGDDSNLQTTEDSNNETVIASLELQSLEVESSNLTIDGFVIANGRRPANGLKINATSKAGSAETLSRSDGSFTLSGLQQGDYDVTVDGGEEYTSAKRLLRAGERGITLAVASVEHKTITGVVSDTYGTPVAGATVRTQCVEPITTGADGSFEVFFECDTKGGVLVRYDASGFLATSRHIVGDKLQQPEIDASVQMREAGVMIFSGNVVDNSESPVANAYVEIESRSPAFRVGVKTDEQGYFWIPNVKPAQSVSLSVKAGNRYKTYRRSRISVLEDTNVLISLKSESLTQLTATITGSGGFALPNMGFLATNTTHQNATVFSTSSAEGVLVIQGISPGSFMLRSAVNSPMIIINGVNVGEAVTAHEINVDVGPYVLRGQLLDADGRPVVDADLNMIHVLESDGITAKTTRTAVSGSDGTFEFGGLGAGEREIVVASETNGSTTFLADPSESTDGVVVLR